ncbi:MAG: radical SAM protein [Candidatus Thiodiazotropha sp.]
MYNSMSNAFIQVGNAKYGLLNQFRKNIGSIELNSDDLFHDLLLEKKILTKREDEEKILIERQYKRNVLCFDNSHMDLSICPTLGCNFQCPYCFEHTQKDVVFMSSETISDLVSFIRSFQSLKSISVTWYGGEPTINHAFEIVREITHRIKNLDLQFKEGGLITNAYLLGKDKIDQLNDLNINNVQITIDGPQETHDARRILASGGPTFHRIMDNIDTLMNSSYSGNCNIRVNLDQANLASFFRIREYLLERYKGKKLTVYAGHVDTTTDKDKDSNCNLCAQEWTDFTIKQFRKLSIPSGEGVYPLGAIFNICSANTKNSFVIGPEGELYKCWEDVGQENMVVGNVSSDTPFNNNELVALYSTGTDPFLDQECKECSVFPICSGGCANRRLRAKYFNEDGMEYCSLYKLNLQTYLTEYYDAFQTKEFCSQVLGKEVTAWEDNGYRVIHD